MNDVLCFSCTMRIGNSVHGPGTVPHWLVYFLAALVTGWLVIKLERFILEMTYIYIYT